MAKQLSMFKVVANNVSEVGERNILLPIPTGDDAEVTEVGNKAAARAMAPDNKGRKKGPYNIVSPELKVTIGRYSAEKGNTNAAVRFGVPESSVRYYKKRYLAKLHDVKDPEKVIKIEHAGRGRPLKLGKLDDKVQQYLKKLRICGGIVNRTIVISVAKGMVSHEDPMLLAENGGEIELGRKWAESLLNRMHFVRRKGTKATRHFPNNFNEIRAQFMTRLKEATEGVPPSLIMNFDQTGLKLIPTSNWSLSAQGEKQVPIVAADVKRENTFLIGITLEGTILPPQIIYAGKTCHLNVPFPRNWNITHSPNHWSNTTTMCEYADKVLLPHVNRIRRIHGLPDTYPAVAVFDVFAAQRIDEFLNKLKGGHIKVAFIPPGCTGELQPLDVSFNDGFKKRMKSKFIYSSEIQKGLDQGKLIEDIHVDLATSKMKVQNGRWILATLREMMIQTDMVKSAWENAGILPEIKDGLGQLPEARLGLFEVFQK